MRIDGKAIAAEIFSNLTQQVSDLKQKGITPHLVVILVGEDPASVSYVRQKELKAGQIGAKATIVKLPSSVSETELLSTIEQYNKNSDVHGIIVQRPLPKHIDSRKIDQAVAIQKDIDAFQKDSPYEMPLAGAVMEILKHVFWEKTQEKDDFSFLKWLKSMKIVVIGKGQTGGGPTIELLRKKGIEPAIIDSKTPDPDKLTLQADILICAVGKSSLIKKENIKDGAILLAVGMHKGTDGKLHGDYEEEEIKDVAHYYTPIPGGVGPVNVAMLLSNLVLAAKG